MSTFAEKFRDRRITRREAFQDGSTDFVRLIDRAGADHEFDTRGWAAHGALGRAVIWGWTHSHTLEPSSPYTLRNQYKKLSNFFSRVENISLLDLTAVTPRPLTAALDQMSTEGVRHMVGGFLAAALQSASLLARESRPEELDDAACARLQELAKELTHYRSGVRAHWQSREPDYESELEGKVLTPTDQDTILAAVAHEIDVIWRAHLRAKDLVKQGTTHDLEDFPSGASLADCLASIVAAYDGGPFPQSAQVAGKERGKAFRRIYSLEVKGVEQEALLLRDSLYFSSERMVMPFIIAALWHTAWNVTPLASLKLSNISGLPDDPYARVPTLLQNELRLSSFKERTGSANIDTTRVVYRTYENGSREIVANHARFPGLATLIQRIRCLTAGLRPCNKGLAAADNLFVHSHSHSVVSVNASNLHSTLAAYRRYSALNVGRRKGVRNPTLPRFKLRDIRATRLNGISVESGLVEAVVFGGHSTRVHARSYLRQPAIEASRARFGVAQSSIERQVTTGGRSQYAEPGLFGTVPGFGCRDPFASPIPSQRTGKLCDAMECATCPLAFISPNDGRSYLTLFRHMESLEAALGRATEPQHRSALSAYLTGVRWHLSNFDESAAEWARENPHYLTLSWDLEDLT